ncbi:MAG: transposase [bacterium]|nr:transposase [bacterium]
MQGSAQLEHRGTTPGPGNAYRRRDPEATTLYRVMQEHLATFLARASDRGSIDPCHGGLPRYVQRELEAYLSCGILARGFVRATCPACKQGILIAFSCKARAVCPSCTGRRMAELAAHLVDHVLPDVPVRQWVLSLPHRVRYLLARHPDLCREVRGIFVRAVQSFYRRRAATQGHPNGRSGAVVQVQRFDSALRFDPHFHALFLDGVHTGFDDPASPLTFHPATTLRDTDIDWLARHIRALVFGHLRRRDFLDDQERISTETEDESDELDRHQAAAIQGMIPFGPHSGERVHLFGEPPETPPSRPYKKLCADYLGYSLHAAVRVAGNTPRLERLCRYIARPPIAQDRLAVARDGSIVYRFRKTWRNGKRAVVMDPMTFISRLAALIPPPRYHTLSYFGVLAPAASRRDEIVPGYQDDDDAQDCRPGTVPATAANSEQAKARKRPERLSWAELVRRVWLQDILHCPCGGRRKVMAMVFNPDSIERILRHLGLPHEAPSRAPPRPMQAGLPFSG